MSDLFAPLRSSEPAPTTPPEQVRRRGERIRRRRTAGQVLAAAVLVGAVATGGFLLDGAGPRTTPPPGPVDRPTATADPEPAPAPVDLTRIDLTRGFPTHGDAFVTGPGARVPAFSDFQVCGRPYPGDRPDPMQRLGVSMQAPEDFRARELTVYADAATAQAALDRFVGLFQACPEDPPGGGAVSRNEVRPVALGDEGRSVLRTYVTDGMPQLGMEIVHAVRVGQVLLLTSQHDEGSGALDMGQSRRRVDEATESRVAPLVEELCTVVAACS
jgi:hypothetical protein